MVSLYDKNETDFSHSGVELADIISCTVTEELNGLYQLELSYPVLSGGNWVYLKDEQLIKADGQLFRIFSVDKSLDFIVNIQARHIFYDLIQNFIVSVKNRQVSGGLALSKIVNGIEFPHPFTFSTDIAKVDTQFYEGINPVEALIGVDSFVTRWDGEIVRDNFNISIPHQRGVNKGAEIVYGKNLLGLTINTDMSNLITRIIPVGRDNIMLPEIYVDSPKINNYALPYTQRINFNVGMDESTSESVVYQRLRQFSNIKFIEEQVDTPFVNIQANLLSLEQTEEFKNVQDLVTVNLGDTVSCTNNPIGDTFEAQVIKIQKDVLTGRNIYIELGQKRKSIADRSGEIEKEKEKEKEQEIIEMEQTYSLDIVGNAVEGTDYSVEITHNDGDTGFNSLLYGAWIWIRNLMPSSEKLYVNGRRVFSSEIFRVKGNIHLSISNPARDNMVTTRGNIYISTQTPTETDGENGDIWVVIGGGV